MKKAWLCLTFFVFLFGAGSYAQGVKIDAPRVVLDKLDTAHVTSEELLKHKSLVAVDPRWSVTRFTISFTLADGKTYGPFDTEGAELPDAAIKVIKRLKTTKAEINIAKINVAKGGVEKFTYPIILRYNN